MRGRKIGWSWLWILLVIGCIDPVELKPTDYQESIVIEGIITGNTGQQINISRTSRINEKKFNGESGAAVSIMDEEGHSYLFSESSAGHYEASMSGVPGKKYTLFVTLKNGRRYISDEVVMRATPPVNSVDAHYKKASATTSVGIYFTVDTGDPTGNTRNYRWTFESTYEIHTPFPSNFEWLGGNNVQARDVPVNICWASDTSKNILIASTNGLSEDRVSQFQVFFLPVYDYAMRIKYSINVRQYSLTPAGYSYWKRLKDINETQGSLYDLQPGVVTGNLHNPDNDTETVLGYFDACEVTSLRVFFTPENFIDQGYTRPGYLTSCGNLIPYEVSAEEIGNFMAETGTRNDLLISEANGAYPATLELRPRYCCDCTSKGTNIKPTFWQ